MPVNIVFQECLPESNTNMSKTKTHYKCMKCLSVIAKEKRHNCMKNQLIIDLN